jgi:hypothetical protein
MGLLASIAALLAVDLLRTAAEDPDENVVGQIDRFIDGMNRRHYAHIDLLLACESYAGDEAGPEMRLLRNSSTRMSKGHDSSS